MNILMSFVRLIYWHWTKEVRLFGGKQTYKSFLFCMFTPMSWQLSPPKPYSANQQTLTDKIHITHAKNMSQVGPCFFTSAEPCLPAGEIHWASASNSLPVPPCSPPPPPPQRGSVGASGPIGLICSPSSSSTDQGPQNNDVTPDRLM